MTLSARIHRFARAATVVVLALAGAQCSVDRTSAPSLTGPSERALSTVMTATPDQLPRDGFSQSTISVVARDANAQPLAGQAFDITVNPTNALLSVQKVVTDGSGVASFTITTLPPGGIAPDNMIRVSVLPVGTNAAGTVSVGGNVDQRTVSIRLLGPSNTVAPTAKFTVTPSDGTTIGQFVTFNANETQDEGEACLANCTYTWSFGDGGTALGRTVAHQYFSAGTFAVTLTVADGSGSIDSATSFVTVGLGEPPAAALSCSPSDPVPDQLVVCDASASTSEVETGATIVSYLWSWGDGNTMETTESVAAHPAGGYSQDGTYTVSVKVTDSYGRTHTATASVAVSTPEP